MKMQVSILPLPHNILINEATSSEMGSCTSRYLGNQYTGMAWHMI